MPTRQFAFSRRSGNRPSEPLTFRQFIAQVNPAFRFYGHLEKLIALLQRVADGELNRLMIFMPPRHGKSEVASRLFSAYYLYRHPDRWVGINSYAAELAYTLSRRARDNYLRAGGQLRDDAAAVRHWETGKNGGLWAAGVGGPITGKGFHLGIIDDPLKNAKEAASATIREAQKDWYRSTFSTREEPGGQIVVIQTRWHEDDLSGWLLAQEQSENEEPERWHIVCLPAVAESVAREYPATCTVEPDWREPGEALCPERYPAEKLRRIRRRVGEYYWAALYQQRPGPKAGDFFRRAWFQVVEALPAGCRFVRYWDKAASQGGGAYTSGVLMARSPDGRYFVVDVVRGQWSSGRRESIIRQTAYMDRQRFGHVDIWLEQEPGSGGKESAEATVRNLAGFSARAEPVTGDKESRARPLAAQAEVGNVFLLAGPWNGAYLEELAAFPHGAYKDQVDASAGAFNKLAQAGWGRVIAESSVVRRQEIERLFG
ncbi:phage terminase large subunit [Caldilinea sp.]|uniref:phage terminase large subunit n=1 Tax=Caldilinea sp. TaxID=2293560 RepID=UPI0021DE1AE1|nr:phage terminase large subunit [Caldilinea sp.]GIV73551.1 MAG: hypothetical protein KatS3mg049_2107 [Caldilinea sp.]